MLFWKCDLVTVNWLLLDWGHEDDQCFKWFIFCSSRSPWAGASTLSVRSSDPWHHCPGQRHVPHGSCRERWRWVCQEKLTHSVCVCDFLLCTLMKNNVSLLCFVISLHWDSKRYFSKIAKSWTYFIKQAIIVWSVKNNWIKLDLKIRWFSVFNIWSAQSTIKNA